MKRLITIAFFAGLATLGAAGAVYAQQPLGDDQLGQIRQNCRLVQTNLRALQRRDTVLRINRGRLYDMTLRQTGAFVARLQHNQIDAPVVKQMDSNIRAEVDSFHQAYDRYAGDLEQAINIDCSEKSQDFYGWLLKATDDRRAVGATVTNIKQYLGQYHEALGELLDERFPVVPEGSAQ